MRAEEAAGIETFAGLRSDIKLQSVLWGQHSGCWSEPGTRIVVEHDARTLRGRISFARRWMVLI